jgi:hypothetical protein
MTIFDMVLLILGVVLYISGMVYVVGEQLIKFSIKCHFKEKEEYHRRIVELGMEDSNQMLH